MHFVNALLSHSQLHPLYHPRMKGKSMNCQKLMKRSLRHSVDKGENELVNTVVVTFPGVKRDVTLADCAIPTVDGSQKTVAGKSSNTNSKKTRAQLQ